MQKKAATKLSEKFQIAETTTFSNKIEKDKSLGKVYKKISDYVYPILRSNPCFGPNIKRLRGELSEFYRYRIGDYRLFYKISEEIVIVFILDVSHKSTAYK